VERLDLNVEVVIPSIRSLRNLEHWRDALEGVHVIVIQDGDPAVELEIPPGLDVTVWARPDIDRLLGERSWVISSYDSACRCFGFLVATARYIYTLDDDCIPPPHRATRSANPLLDHLENLRSPSHPDYFNTLYDVEFVRGYPHSLRDGRPTAISHGLWLDHPDLDAVTQRARPELRIRDEVPVVQTVPRGAQYSMCGMNLAFDRALIGPAMYFGLMGAGQPWGRYDDLWAGWCSKVICDHLGYGAKTGRPYIVHQKASNWKTNLEREANGLRWAADLHAFFEGVAFDHRHTTVAECYIELAGQMQDGLGALDPYFVRLAEAMIVWVELWEEIAMSNRLSYAPAKHCC
jgi:reversibly glycosylated polypeptide/UDP-arabinopyranose mutase